MRDSDETSSTSMSRDEIDEQKESSTKQPEMWQGKLDFFLACVGCAVGLGNIWRFPYLCYKNGGGSFLIPYVIVLVCAGVPVLFLELALGQLMSKGGIQAWDICPILKGVGYSCTIIIMLCNIYYIVILAWTILYMYFSFSWSLPWATCDNWWNTDRCRVDMIGHKNDLQKSSSESKESLLAIQQTLRNMSTPFPTEEFYNSTGNLNLTASVLSSRDSVTEFWEHRILQISGGIEDADGFQWELVVALLIAWSLVYLCIWKGVKIFGKVVYFTALFPYVILTILLIRGVTLPGAVDGLIFYLKPDFTKLAMPQVWIDAGTQVFYSSVLGMNCNIAMGSYNKFNKNFYKEGIALGFVNSGSSIFAGFAVFSVLGFMAKQQGVSVDEVATSGPGLVFIAYPQAVVQMPLAPVWAILFFFMILIVGLDSAFAGVEAVMRVAKDRWPCVYEGSRKELLAGGYVLVSLLIGLSMVTRVSNGMVVCVRDGRVCMRDGAERFRMLAM